MSIALLHKGILGTKLGMTQVFQADGDAVPVTVVEAGPCTVTQIKKADGPDGYEALQIGYGSKRDKLITKPLKGHFAKHSQAEPLRHLAEIRLAPGAAGETKAGDKMDASVFAVGDYVDVVGVMKGRGFSGVVRRHGFSTQKESHGAHYHWRHGGSIGCRKPEHVRKGKRMGGQYGNTRKTVQNLKIIRVDVAKNLLYILGAIPGANGNLVMVRQAKKKKAAKPAA